MRALKESPNKATVINTDVQQVVRDLVSCKTSCKAKAHESSIYLRLKTICVSLKHIIQCQIKNDFCCEIALKNEITLQ
jgi:hypothetical protein